ncbi:MAG: type VI secretion system tube protein Hcp [Phycisphaerae bacterium]|nr:type VI secretion system tube protein Hcp [Phycisphaerae bacterium]
MLTDGFARKLVVFVLATMAVLIVAIYSPAGPLQPTAPPAGTMHTLDEIYANTASVVVPPEILARARGRAYLRIDSILGESKDEAHEKWIDIFGIGYQEKMTIDYSGGGGVGKVSFSDISIVKEVDISSPKLALACAKGTHIKQVVIDCMTNTEKAQRYFVLTLNDVIIAGVAPKMVYRGNGFVFMEEVSLNFARIQWEYYPFDETGVPGSRIETYWDLKQNTGG